MKGIYKIVNKLNDKFYLGSTSNFHKRKLRHFNELRKNKHHSIYLQRAFNKYGEENFEFIEIEVCENTFEREQEILDSMDYNLCYNVSKSASGGDLISNHPNVLEIKNNARINILKAPNRGPVNKDKNPNWKGGISKTNYASCGNEINFGALKCSNCHFSERNIFGIKNPFYGKSHSQETKEILRNSRLGTYNGNQEKAVIINNIEYKSLSEASKVFNVVPATILNRIRNKNYPTYKYK